MTGLNPARGTWAPELSPSITTRNTFLPGLYTTTQPSWEGCPISMAANSAARSEIEATVGRIHKVETAIEPRFQEHFVAANAIPHATDPFPELTAVVSLPDVAFNTGGGDGARRRRRSG